MVVVPRVGDLEIATDEAFRKRGWSIQRRAWAVMTAVLGAAMLGLFGTGPFSRAQIRSSDDSLRLRYERFGRFESESTLSFDLRDRMNRQGEHEVRLWLDQAYLDSVRIERIEPEPDRTEASSDRVVFVFRTAGPDRPIPVRFHLIHRRMGRLRGHAGTDRSASLEFSAFIYP